MMFSEAWDLTEWYPSKEVEHTIYPPKGWWQIDCPTLVTLIASQVSHTNFKIYMKYIFAVVRETAGAGDIALAI